MKHFSFHFGELWDGDHDGGGEGEKSSPFSIGVLGVRGNHDFIVRIGEDLIVRQRVQRQRCELSQLIHQLGCLAGRVPQPGSIMDRESDVLHLHSPFKSPITWSGRQFNKSLKNPQTPYFLGSPRNYSAFIKVGEVTPWQCDDVSNIRSALFSSSGREA